MLTRVGKGNILKDSDDTKYSVDEVRACPEVLFFCRQMFVWRGIVFGGGCLLHIGSVVCQNCIVGEEWIIHWS